MKTFNLKELGANRQDSVILVEMFLEEAKLEKEVVVKILHGYGSHGVGGVLFTAVRERLEVLKRQGKIKEYFGGEKWNLLDGDTREAIFRDKSCLDEDLNKSNPGITIVVL